MADSPVTSATYTLQVAAPTVSPPGGTYPERQSVTISGLTVGATYRYTTDGSTPTILNGNVYPAPIMINFSTTLKIVGYKTGYLPSGVVQMNYTILPDVPMTLEAETMARTSSGPGTSNNNDIAASGGIWVLLQATAANQWIQFTTPSIPAGTYQLQLRYKANATRCQH